MLFNSEVDKVQTAAVVKSFMMRKRESIKNNDFSVWCFGYDMDNMKARCWYEQKMPLFNISQSLINEYVEGIRKITEASKQCVYTLKNQIKAAWSDTPKDLGGDISYIDSTFYSDTEDKFYQTADAILQKLTNKTSISAELADWREYIIKEAMKLFARFALQDTDVTKNMKRAVKAEKNLGVYLYKDKQISLLKEEE